jgi:hypothetical protein
VFVEEAVNNIEVTFLFVEQSFPDFCIQPEQMLCYYLEEICVHSVFLSDLNGFASTRSFPFECLYNICIGLNRCLEKVVAKSS